MTLLHPLETFHVPANGFYCVKIIFRLLTSLFGYFLYLLPTFSQFLEPDGGFILKLNFAIRNRMFVAVLPVTVKHGFNKLQPL